MISLLGAETALDAIVDFFKSIVSGMSLDIVMFISVGLLAVIFIAAILRLVWCYESRAIRQMHRINKYLKENPKINDSNLVEFHNKMRKLPRRFRDRWQLFMLEREGSPSRYMTVEYCVKRPLYNSAYKSVRKQITYTAIVLAILSFIGSVAYLAIGSGDKLLNVSILLQFLTIPLIVGLFGCVFCMIIQLRYTVVTNNFYDEFTDFMRNIDKCTNAMPDYVDYELLFTPKEINAGIPVLREYLEKRALEEQRLLEKAKQEDANHSPYNFADLGVNGSQLIERAVTESEKFLMSKIQIQQEITDLEKQLQKTEANKEDIEREANRKLQAIKENLERLDKAMAETTNRVEINYNRRQATEEMNKKAKLEKDLENMLNKEQVQIDALNVEIQKRKEIVEGNKEEVETALKSEYDTFATKVYQELTEKITRDNSEQMRDLEMVIARLKAKVQEYNKDIEKRDNLVEARSIEVENLRHELRKAKTIIKDMNKKRGKNAINVDAVIKEPEHYDPDKIAAEKKAEAKADEFAEEPVAPKQDEFVEVAAPVEVQAPQDEFIAEAPISGDEFTQPMDMPIEEQNVPAIEPEYVEQPMEQSAYGGEYVEQPQFDQNGEIYGEMPADMGYDMQQPMDGQFVEQPMQDEFIQPEMQPVDEFEQPQQVDEFEPVNVEQVEKDNGGKKAQIKKGKIVKPAKKPAKDEKIEEKPAENNEKEEKLEEKTGGVASETENKDTQKSDNAELKAAHQENKEAIEDVKSTVDALKKEIAEMSKAKEEEKAAEEEKKTAANDELEALQKQINAENERLKKQQEELRAQIDETLKTMEKATNATKAERTRNIKKIKDLIAQLKQEAVEAKERGASKSEINKINKSAAELVKVIADYQANKPIASKTAEK